MEHGMIRIHLEELIQRSGMSKNKFLHRADMERTQLNRYCSNDVARVDLDVLARICSVLGCTVGELLEFVPDEGTVQGKEVVSIADADADGDRSK